MSQHRPDIPAGTWQIDPSHSGVTFSARHMMVSKVRGRLQRLHRRRSRSPTTPRRRRSSAIVQMASIDTGDEDRDDHLRTNDFFDVANSPTMTFRVDQARRVGGDYKLHGDLTIKGVTKPVTLDLEVGGVGKDPWGNTRPASRRRAARSTARTSA